MRSNPENDSRYTAIRVRQGIITGHLRYILGISLALSIVALIIVYAAS